MLKRIVFTLIVVYLILLGATFNGILQPNLRLLGVLLVGVITLVWLGQHRSRRWTRTPLDGAILLWVAALALSLVTNFEAGRRIALGLWFVGAYIGAWYVLQDAFVRRTLRRDWLIDALLIAGAVTTFVGYAQVEVALMNGDVLPRPVGTFGNPNFLAAFLVLLLPFIAGRLSGARMPLARVLLGVYGVAAAALLLLSFSRGGWIAALVGLAVWAALSLPLRRWWQKFGLPVRLTLAAVALVGLVGGSIVVVRSFAIGGRGLEFRTFIYDTALRDFTEHPLTGSGLFTFGASLAQYNSMPPYEPHSHAHNIVLHVAAELGMIGLLVLGVTAWAILRAVRRQQDRIAIMGSAAFAGFAVHLLLDLPAMMPAVALVALAALVLAAPGTESAGRGRGQPLLIALGGAILFVTGLWSGLNYRAYVAALSDGVATGNYRAAAEQLQPLEAADPRLAIYPDQRGMLYGLAASAGDTQSARDGADRFARFVALEPVYATGWANLAALREQSGDLRGAADAMAQASTLTPSSWSLLYRAGVYAEAAGAIDDARAKYAKLIRMDSGVLLLPDWADSPLRRSLEVGDEQRTLMTRMIPLLEAGNLAAAQSSWDADPTRLYGSSDYRILALMVALTRGDRDSATSELQHARDAVIYPRDRAWTHVGAALLDGSRFDAEEMAARAEVYVSITGSDWATGVNVPYLQFLHLAIPRQFLPQVGYTESDPVLIHLLESPDALNRLRNAIGA